MIDTALTAEGWIDFLNPLAAFDKAGDAKRGPTGCAAGIFLLVTFIAVVTIPPPYIGVAVAPLVAAIYLFLRWRKMKKQDIPNALREFVLPLVSVLREDVDPNEPVHLKLDLRGGTFAAKKQRSQTVNDKGYPKVSLDFYSDPWMLGEAKLVDGSTVSWEIQDEIRQRNVTKRNPRGKIKHKVKYKVRRTMDARIAFPSSDFKISGSTDGRNEGLRIRLKEGEKRKVFQTRRRTVGTTIDTSPDVAELLGLITSAYGRVSANPGGEKS